MAAVRGDLRSWLARGLEGEALDDVLLIVSEMVGNAIAACPPETQVSVSVVQDEAGISAEVSNRGCSWVEPDTRWDLEDPLRTGGRGLLIIRSLAEDVEIVQDDDADTTTIRARYPVEVTVS